MEKLLIIDGHNLLFQMFFGMPSRIVNKQGKAIHGTLGFVGALNKIMKLTVPTHVVVVFDGEHQNSRAEILPEYKANRIDYSEIPDNENPFSQLEDIYSALDFMGIRHYEEQEFEADDTIASYVITYSRNMRVIISSFDSDFFQLINDNVSVLRYRGDKTIICDTAYIQNKFGIFPEQYADFKSLTGDGSDNIKGAEKVGVKTAADLIKQFGNIQNVIRKADEIVKPRIRESVKSSANQLEKNLDLIKLKNNCRLRFEITALLYESSGFATNEILKAIGLYE
ncbi:MAG: flap endonuclease [Oscillospiraceae bacterium]|nr:flap endonuclease [Oscillospiraceae bacterium]